MSRRSEHPWPLRVAALLWLSLSACALGPPPRPASPPRPATGVEHTVQKGETLWQISRAYGVTIEMIALANELDSQSRIDVGQKLFIPGASRPIAQTAPPSPPPRVAQTARPERPRQPKPPPPPPPAPQASPPLRPQPRPPVAQAMPTLKQSADQGEREHEDAPTPTRRADVAPVAESNQYLPPPASPDRPLAWPVRGVLYARFGKRAESVHDGIDLSAPEGTPIRAAADGRVLFSAPQHGYGNLIIIEHQDGLLTLYAHNRENLVKEGDRVRLGQVIARVGRGSATSGPYLHFEVRVAGQPVDPLPYLPPPR